MTNPRFSTTASNAIDAFGATARSAIEAYRAGGDQLGTLAAEQWSHAFRKASPKLTPETRKNASHARKVFGGYYARGVDLSASGAAVAVDTLVRAAQAGVERADAFAQARKTA